MPVYIFPFIYILSAFSNVVQLVIKKRSINLKEINDKDRFIQAFRDYTLNKTDNSWIEGGNWDHENWGGMLPSKSWIDSITLKNPVLVTRIDGHMALSNSCLLYTSPSPRDKRQSRMPSSA